MTCVSPGSSTLKANIQDWTPRTSCPKLMVFSVQSNSCICLKAYYFDGTSCTLCAAQCDGCTGPNTCIKLDLIRNPSGGCPSTTYDEGYICMPGSYRIPNRTNLEFSVFPLGAVGEGYYQQSPVWTSSDNSFFLGFKIGQLSITDPKQLVAYIRASSINLFSIFSTYDAPSQKHQICLYFNSNLLRCFYVNPRLIWIGLWTNFITAIFAIGSHGQTSYDRQNISGFSNMVSPIICVGTCFITGETQFTGIIQGKVQFFKGVTDPIDNMNDFLRLRMNPSELYFHYTNQQIEPSKKYFYNLITTFPETKDKVLKINSLQSYLQSGIRFQPQPDAEGQLDDITFGQELTFFGVFVFDSLVNHFQFFNYEMNGLKIQYKFSRYASKIGVQICIENTCKSTKNCQFQNNASSFLAIIPSNQDEGSPDSFFYEFEVVCNYSRNTLIFHFPIADYSYDKLNIRVPVYTQFITTLDRGYYINNFKIILGAQVYFDYTQTDPCFLYYNLSDMKCLRAKKGKLLNQGVVVTVPCYTFSLPNYSMVENIISNECMLLNRLLPGCVKVNNSVDACISCVDPNTLFEPTSSSYGPSYYFNCQECKKGFFRLSINDLCEPCHPKCNQCKELQTCTTCNFINTEPPICNCIYANQYQNSSFQCEDCSPKCASCSGSRNNCDECSSDQRIYPLCDCNPQYYDQVLSTETYCAPIICSNRCQTCEYTPDNCTQCREYSVDPSCDCLPGYFEYLGQCMICTSHQFWYINMCKECDANCKACAISSNQCTDCIDGTVLFTNVCLCSDLSTFILSPTGSGLCKTFMEIELAIEQEDDKFHFNFEFDDEINSINFAPLNIDKIIFFYIEQVQSEDYYVSDPQAEESSFKIDLNFRTSFKKTRGKLLFLNTRIFQNSMKYKELNVKYMTTYINFTIGPYLNSITLEEAEGGSVSIVNSVQEVSKTLSRNNSTTLSFLRQFQILFYALNTLQPCVSLLMVHVIPPDNVQLILKIPGLLIFPKVEDSFTILENQEFLVFGITLKPGKEVSVNSSLVFQRLGLSNCLIVNIALTLIQNVVWCSIYFVIIIIQQRYLTRKYEKLKEFILIRIVSNLEVGALVLSTSIFNQLHNIDRNQSLNRLSQYVLVVLTIFIIQFYIRIYYNLSIKSTALKKFKVKPLYLDILGKLDYQYRLESTKNYFFFQLIKKYVLSAIIVFLEKYPSFLCASASLLFFSSFIVTIFSRPYKNLMSNMIKILGEALMVAIWMVYFLRFVPFQKYYLEEKQIPNDELIEYLRFGNLVMYLIIAFNLIYVFELLWNAIIMKIYHHYQIRQVEVDNQGEVEEMLFVLKQARITQEIQQFKLRIHWVKNKI